MIRSVNEKYLMRIVLFSNINPERQDTQHEILAFLLGRVLGFTIFLVSVVGGNHILNGQDCIWDTPPKHSAQLDGVFVVAADRHQMDFRFRIGSTEGRCRHTKIGRIDGLRSPERQHGRIREVSRIDLPCLDQNRRWGGPIK
ncbi:hypothetical protein [Novipirellula aureliae]|uniref:hypothetical protein n=1 Tax=Novipirellula aureliae TaxID=2527966 RepID=UPI0011B3C838|nr:hypothetical protein [Novipirellula aureliae]